MSYYKKYWEERYKGGLDSGAGSYGIMAEFKAEIVNTFIENNKIETVLDFGCGDGNQLSYLKCKKYIGIDVSPMAIEICKKKFSSDQSKTFQLYDPTETNSLPECDLVLCLDVLYHIIPEHDFNDTLDDIFSHAKKAVILYTIVSDCGIKNDHMYSRNTIQYLERFPGWEKEIIKQKYPGRSGADFIILIKEEL